MREVKSLYYPNLDIKNNVNGYKNYYLGLKTKLNYTNYNFWENTNLKKKI
jgi:hypothetical protein